jgi:hypothetical protein
MDRTAMNSKQRGRRTCGRRIKGTTSGGKWCLRPPNRALAQDFGAAGLAQTSISSFRLLLWIQFRVACD